MCWLPCRVTSVCVSLRLAHKDSLKTNLKACGIDPRELSHAPLNKSAWSSRCRDAVVDFEDRRVDSLLQSALDARHRTKVPGLVASAAPALVSPVLDCWYMGDHTESREICWIDGSIQTMAGCLLQDSRASKSSLCGDWRCCSGTRRKKNVHHWTMQWFTCFHWFTRSVHSYLATNQNCPSPSRDRFWKSSLLLYRWDGW